MLRLLGMCPGLLLRSVPVYLADSFLVCYQQSDNQRCYSPLEFQVDSRLESQVGEEHRLVPIRDRLEACPERQFQLPVVQRPRQVFLVHRHLREHRESPVHRWQLLMVPSQVFLEHHRLRERRESPVHQGQLLMVPSQVFLEHHRLRERPVSPVLHRLPPVSLEGHLDRSAWMPSSWHVGRRFRLVHCQHRGLMTTIPVSLVRHPLSRGYCSLMPSWPDRCQAYREAPRGLHRRVLLEFLVLPTLLAYWVH